MGETCRPRKYKRVDIGHKSIALGGAKNCVMGEWFHSTMHNKIVFPLCNWGCQNIAQQNHDYVVQVGCKKIYNESMILLYIV